MYFAVLVLLLVGRSVSGLYTHADADIEVGGLGFSVYSRKMHILYLH